MTETMTRKSEAWLEAQIAVLGSVIRDPGAWAAQVVARTRPEDFCDAYRPVYDVIRAKFTAGEPIDQLTVRAGMDAEYSELVRQMVDVTPTAANCGEWLEQMLEAGRLIKLAEIGEALQTATDAEDAARLLDEANRLSVRREKAQVVTLSEALSGFYSRQQAEPVKYLTWGMNALDSRLYVEQGDMVILGGYPSDGKTALALAMAYTQGVEHRVGFYSLETKTSKLFDRLVPTLTSVDFGRVKRQGLTDGDWETLAGKSKQIQQNRLELVQAAGMSVADIKALAQSRRQEIIYIDYLQLIKPADPRRPAFEQVTQISMDLHSLAQSTGITVVALSQLSRPEKEGSKPKAPGMSALRQSGQIEQDADVIMLLYREDPTARQSKRLLKVAKNKEGEAGGILRLDFDGATQTFRPDRNDPAVWRAPQQQPQIRELPNEEVPWDRWERAQ